MIIVIQDIPEINFNPETTKSNYYYIALEK